MKNVTAKIEGNDLVIRVNLNEKGEPSKTGKTNLIGNSGGFAAVEGKAGYKFSLNVIGPKG